MLAGVEVDTSPREEIYKPRLVEGVDTYLRTFIATLI
jgi:hypothetical protein